MTKIEERLLNTIENADNRNRVGKHNYTICDIDNDFELEVSPEKIILHDSDFQVAAFNRGYVMLSQIIPIIAEIITPYGE